MINVNDCECPICNGELKYYDSISRIIREKYRETEWIKIRRFRCNNCRVLHRELPECLIPFKQYDAEVIFGVVEGIITSETLGYEDYPCEAIMLKWIKQIKIT